LLAADVGITGGLRDHQVTAQAVLDLLDWNLFRVAVGDVLAGGNDLLANLDAILVEVLDVVSHLAWLAEQLIDQVSVESLDVDLDLVSRYHGRCGIDADGLHRVPVLRPAEKNDNTQYGGQHPTTSQCNLQACRGGAGPPRPAGEKLMCFA